MRTRSSQHVFKRLSIGRRSLRWGGLGIALVAPLMTAAPASAAPFVYVTESPADIVSANDATSGSLLPLPHDQTTGTNPIGVAVTPDGTSVYVANFGDGKTFGSVSEYDVAADGTLTPKTAGPVKSRPWLGGYRGQPRRQGSLRRRPRGRRGVPVRHRSRGSAQPDDPRHGGGGIGPRRIAVSPNGKSVYVTDRDKLLQYSVGAGDKLTPKTPATVATGNGPGQVGGQPRRQERLRAQLLRRHRLSVQRWQRRRAAPEEPRDGGDRKPTERDRHQSRQPERVRRQQGARTGRTIAQYAATANGLVLKTPETIAAGLGPDQVVVSPTGNNLYATDSSRRRAAAVQRRQRPGNAEPVVHACVPVVRARRGPRWNRDRADDDQLQLLHRDQRMRRAHPFPSAAAARPPPVILATRLVRGGAAGILVQRLVGKRRLAVGRVPFGLRRTGRQEDPLEPASQRTPATQGPLPDHAADVRPPRAPDRPRPADRDQSPMSSVAAVRSSTA